VSLQKPIIVIKAGRSEQAAKAAASHTGSLAGSDDVLDAAFRRCGVLRVNSISEVFDMVDVLARQPRPKSNRLLIVTNAGGPGVLAADALLAGGGALSELSLATTTILNATLPPHWSHGNPVDVIGDADPERYARAIEAASLEPSADALLVIMTPQGMTDPVAIAERLTPYADFHGKPILASWMGGAGVATGANILSAAGIPSFPYPDDAVRAFLHMWRFDDNLKNLYETPALVEEPGASTAQVAQLLAQASADGRAILTEFESKQIFRMYGIPVLSAVIAVTEEEAARAAVEVGYPVALKLHSHTITHKTEVGGVQLNLADEEAVCLAFNEIRRSVKAKAGPGNFDGVTVQRMAPSGGYELILGCTSDAQFGPVLLFGAGGQLVEVMQDRALGIPPLNTTLARHMIEQTRIYRALRGVRGRKPVDLAALERLVVRCGQLVLEHPIIKEFDINPLLASPDEIVALDARIVLHAPGTEIPRPAIRPYPALYTTRHEFAEGSQVLIRPIRPDDEPLIAAFHRTLSDQSVFLRYSAVLKLDIRVAHERLSRICFVDYDREIAFVAESLSDKAILGVARLAKIPNTKEAEAAFIVSDSFQRHGLGAALVKTIIKFARDESLNAIRATFLSENSPMRKLFERSGFRISERLGESEEEAVLQLGSTRE
jgi:acetyltransferase